jgi:hypothetical protein
MPFRGLKLAGSAIIAAALLAPEAASARARPHDAPQPYYAAQRDRDGYLRAGRGRDGYAYDGYYGNGPPPPRRAGYRERRAVRCDRGNVGTILGAIAGGLLGNAAIGRHGNHAAGTLAGAGAGALIGHATDQDCD